MARELIHADDEILQALAACGVYIYDKLSGTPRRNWTRLPGPVRQLAERLISTFDPDVHPEMRSVTQQYWATAEDEQFHFVQWGSVIRRLMDSVKHHQKSGPRAYCRWVVPFVARWSPDTSDDKVHWSVLSLRQPNTEQMDERLPNEWTLPSLDDPSR